MSRNDEIKRLHVSFSFFFIAVFGNRRGIRKSDEKITGCGILVKKERVRDEGIRGLHFWYLDP